MFMEEAVLANRPRSLFSIFTCCPFRCFFFPGIVAAGWGAHWPLPMNFKTTLPCTPSWTPQVEGYRIPLGLDGAPGQGKKEKRNVEGWRKSMEDGEAELKTQRERFYY